MNCLDEGDKVALDPASYGSRPTLVLTAYGRKGQGLFSGTVTGKALEHRYSLVEAGSIILVLSLSMEDSDYHRSLKLHRVFRIR